MTDRLRLGGRAAAAAALLAALVPTLASASPPHGSGKGSAPGAAHGSKGKAPEASGSKSHSSGAGGSGTTSVACPAVALSQPFLAWGDKGEYTLLGGETPDSFTGSGWVLSGGARVVSARLRDGRTDLVLDLPAGASAVSPAICVSSAYPKARTLVRDLAGSQGIHVNVSFFENGAWGRTFANGAVKGLHGTWAASVPIMIHAASLKGMTPARFTLDAQGRGSDYQLYDFYVDPRLIK